MFNSLVIPLDGSAHSERALATGLELARLTGASVTILTVVLGYKDAHVAEVPRLEAKAKERAQAYIQPFVDEGRTAGFEITGEVGHGAPAEEILRCAHDHDADLIVMSTHGIGADGRHALGSVALRVLQTAACPVLFQHIDEAKPA